MNFKTTIILIVLLAAAGVYLFVSRNEAPKSENSVADQSKLVDIDAKDVTKLIVTPGDGVAFTLEKAGTDWQITDPVKAAAETFEVDSLVRSFTDAKTRGQVDPGAGKPKYQVQLVTASKTVKFSIGEKSAVGDNLYVQVDGDSKANIVGTELSDKLDKGVDVYRRMNLITATSDQIKQISITRSDGKIVLQKIGEHWQMTEPVREPVEDSAASDLVFAITGLRADSFVDAKSLPAVAMSHPQMTVAFTSALPVAPPAPPPSTAPAWTTLQFGSFDDILKKNVFVTVEGSGAVAKVSATSLDSFKKKPLDIRDKKLVNLDPEQVTKVSLQIETAATTQPTVQAAVSKTVVLEKRKADSILGPPNPATSQATTLPAAQKSKWIVSSEVGADSDDAKVTTLLGAMHPLTVEKFLETAPTTQPSARYVLTVTTVAAGAVPVDNQITVIDPGHDQPLIGSYNGVAFEAARSLLTNFAGEWKKP